MTREIVKDEAEIKSVRAELMKVQAYMTKYLMTKEELTREAAKAKNVAKG